MKTDANRQANLRLELFARLANIETLGALKDWEKLQLVDETREAGFSWLDMKPSIGIQPGRQLPSWRLHQEKGDVIHDGYHRPIETWGMGEPIPFEWQALLDAHEWGRPVVNDLLNGKEIFTNGLNMSESMICKFDPATGKLQSRLFIGSRPRELLIAFKQDLMREAFPFRRCPVCSTIFVPGKNQKYCSSACTTNRNEAARKGTRKEYMRELMRKKRERAKAKAAAEERARKQARTPAVKSRGTLSGKAEKR